MSIQVSDSIAAFVGTLIPATNDHTLSVVIGGVVRSKLCQEVLVFARPAQRAILAVEYPCS